MLPWVKVSKEYIFDTPSGRKTLADPFEGRSQLLVYHFMPDRIPNGHATYNYSEMPVPAGSKDMEMPGLSAFSKNERGEVFHTCSCCARGLEDMAGTLMFLDRAPKGRNEKSTMDFVRRHDEYANPRRSNSCCS